MPCDRRAARQSLRCDIASTALSTACTAVPKMLVFSTSGIASSARIASTGIVRPHFENRPRREDAFQLVDRAERRQPACLDDRDPLTVLGLVEVVRGDEHGDAVARETSSMSRQNLPARQRIDAAGRLVEKHNRRLVEDRAAEREALTPAAESAPVSVALAAAQARHVEHEVAAGGEPVARSVHRCRRRTRCSDRRSASRTARTAATCSRCAA